MDRLVLHTAEAIETYIHPFRAKIMRVMRETGRPMTVKEIADAMGQTAARIHYHVQKLLAIDVLRLDHTRLVNGIVAKYYTFAYETVALDVPDDDAEKKEELNERLLWEYSRIFDQVKQGYYDLYARRETGIRKEDQVYMTLKESYPVDPKDLEAIYEEFGQVLRRYRCDGPQAVPHWVLLSMFPHVGREQEPPEPAKNPKG